LFKSISGFAVWLILFSSSLLAQQNSQDRGVAPSFRNGNLKRAKAFGALPITFEQNLGQTDGTVQFVARGRGYSFFFTGTTAVSVLQGSFSAHNRSEAAG